jgi:hypothetical protein
MGECQTSGRALPAFFASAGATRGVCLRVAMRARRCRSHRGPQHSAPIFPAIISSGAGACMHSAAGGGRYRSVWSVGLGEVARGGRSCVTIERGPGPVCQPKTEVQLPATGCSAEVGGGPRGQTHPARWVQEGDWAGAMAQEGALVLVLREPGQCPPRAALPARQLLHGGPPGGRMCPPGPVQGAATHGARPGLGGSAVEGRGARPSSATVGRGSGGAVRYSPLLVAAWKLASC